MWHKSVVFLILWWLDIEIKLLSCKLFENIQNVLTGLLEMTGWVV